MGAELRTSRGKLVPLIQGAGVTAVPSTATGGRSLENFDRPYHEEWLVEVTAATATSGAVINLWGYNPGNKIWFKVASLNGGSALTIGTGEGYSEIVRFIGYDRMGVEITGITGTVNIDATNLMAKRIG